MINKLEQVLCKKQQQNCIAPHEKSNIKLVDKGNAGEGGSCDFHIENPTGETYHQILVDNCLMPQQSQPNKQSQPKSCDWMICSPSSEIICLVELKKTVHKSDMKSIHDKFKSTIDLFKPPNYNNFKLFLVASKVADGQATRTEIIDYFHKSQYKNFSLCVGKSPQGNSEIKKKFDDIFPPIETKEQPSKTTP